MTLARNPQTGLYTQSIGQQLPSCQARNHLMTNIRMQCDQVPRYASQKRKRQIPCTGSANPNYGSIRHIELCNYVKMA